MKVLHICKVYLPTKGGVQMVVKWLCDGLSDCGYQSEVLSTSLDPKLRPTADVDGTRITNSKSYIELFSLPIAPDMIRQIWSRANKFDLICVHYPFPLADLAIALMSRRKFSLIVYWHSEIVAKTFLSYLVTPFTKLMLTKADSIVCSSPLLLEHSELLKPHHEKCQIIPFGIEKPISKLQIRPDKSNYFIFVGRHVPYKGIETLIRGFAYFTEQSSANTKFKLKIVGSGPLLRKHQTIANELGIKNSIDFLEHVENIELETLLAKSRCLVLSSTLPSEAFALVQIEAMALGRPVINTSLKSGVPWVARHQKEALTVEPGNIIELATAFENMTNNNELVNKLGTAATLRFNKVFEHKKFLSSTDSMFSTLLDNRNQKQ